ncbi:MAG: Ig-like domain-containing protein, partial [Verrucomicrobiales bacterium]|nr:Ig-like domain-containing protein [Verrucomicrobiales bacterium]
MPARLPRTAVCILAMLMGFLLGGAAVGQGVLNTEPGVTLGTASRPVVFEGGDFGNLLQLSFGFSTDEIVRPGVIPDSFTITLQEMVSDQVLVLVNMDVSGTVWGPFTPGAVPLPQDSLDRAPISYPSLTPVLASRTAYQVELALPSEFQGRPLTLFFDLFSNDNGEASQAWFSEAVVVPEPGLVSLLVLGGAGVWWAGRRRGGRPGGGSRLLLGLALIGGGVIGANRTVAADKTFRIQDSDVVLAEVTPDADVYFRSMRLNRAQNVWNVELVVSNKSSRTLTGPLVLLVDSFQGTPGLIGPDGLDDSQPAKAFLDLSAAAGNGSLSPGEVTSARTLTLGRSAAGSPSLATRLYAARPPAVATLAVTRSLDGVGQPLPGVLLSGAGPSGALDQRSDSPSGVASFGRGAGEHQVRFSLEGYLPVWRREILAADQTTVVPNPRLTARSPAGFPITPLGGSVMTNSDGSLVLQVPPGVVQEPVTATLTGLSGQSLPGFLPRGWSPLASFWLETSAALRGALPGEIKPWGPILPSETAALARWDDQRLEWIVTGTVAGRGSNAVPVEISSAGAYALVVGDAGDLAPPAPVSGQALKGSSNPSPDIAGLSATGTVTPSFSPASVIPEQVTGTAHMVIRHATASLPSGTLFRGEVTETYHLRDGSLRLSPQYEGFIVGYQRPGDADPRTLDAEFPMRPLLLFGPDQLSEATVRMEILPEQPFDGQVLDPTGGQISSGSIRLVAGVGRLSVPSALRLRRLDATAFTNLVSGGNAVVAAFDLTLDGSTLAGTLAAQVGGLASGGRFVLAQILSETGFYGLQPVERLQSDAAGTLRSLEPATGERLPGVRGSGQYVLVSVDQPQGLVTGIARDGAGVARPGMPVSLAGLPWLARTDAEGRYRLVAPAGTRELMVRDPATGDAGIVSITVSNPGIGSTQDVGTAPHGPRVARITPNAGAVRVPRVVSVVIEFDEAVNPGSVVGGIQLLKPDNSPVPAAVTLNLANRVATLSPSNELEANTAYRVRLAPGIRDPGGLPLEGTNEFTFTTVPLSTRDPAAQLIIYQPGATNIPAPVLAGIPAYTPGSDPSAIVVHGTPGTADPEVAVILVNESTGETATVLSKADGSFSNVIPGAEQDFVSATFVNLNGTRVYVPVSRQLFDNGFVGLYPQGGILEAQSDGGPVQVLIKPNAVPNRTKFRVKTLSRAQLLQETGGVTPDVGTFGASAMRIELEGPAPKEPMEVRFPVNLAQLGYPTNESPSEVAAALAVVRKDQGVTTFEVADQMLFQPQSTPQNRAVRPGGGGVVRQDLGEDFAGILYTVAGFAPSLTVGLTPLIFDFVVVPMLLGNKPILIKGITQQLPREAYNPSTGAIEQISDAINNAAEEYFAAKENVVPVQGAFVILRLTTNPASTLPGRLNPGTVHATSGADGSYLMIAPSASQDYILAATHPGFVDRPSMSVKGVRDIKFSGFVFKRLIFHTLNVADTPLRLNVAHAPQFPAPNTDCDLQVSAFRGAGASPDILVTLSSVTNLTEGDPARFSDVTISNVTVSTTGVTRIWRGTVRASKPVQAIFKITADGVVSQYPINFSGVIPPVISGPLPKPDTNDVHGPLVVSTLPPEAGYLAPSGEVTLLFNKPIDRSVEQALSGLVLDGPSSPAKPIIRLDGGQKALSIRYAGLEPDREYTLTLTSEAIRDLAGQPLDQRPSTPEPDSFRLRFRSSPVRSVVLPGMGTGRGTVISGSTLYAIEVSATGGALLAFDISNPSLPSLSRRQPLPGQPRDLVLIPKYSYRRSPGAPVETNDLVAVVGGELDTYLDQFGNAQVPGQYLAVYNMLHPDGPQRLASPMVTYRVGSVVSKIRWSAPHLIYQEFGADLQQLVAVNLQEMMVAFGGIPEEFLNLFGPDGRPGKDANGDGDFVDEGDLLPIPAIPSPEFAGKKFSYVLSGTTQRILDFSPVAAGQVVGVTLTRGAHRGDSGEVFGRIPPSYRTLSLSLNTADPENAMYRFPDAAYPRWVSVFPSLTILSNDVPTLPSVALVSLQPDADGKQSLAVLDISLPQSPRLINQIRIPEELLGGPMQSIRQREDGLLELAGSQHLLVLDSRRFGVTNVPSGQAHPAIVSFLASAGSGTRSLGTTPFGYHSVADGARTLLLQTPPTLRFLSFPGAGAVLHPSDLARRTDSELAELMQGARPTGAIPPARARAHPKADLVSTLDPPLPAAHFYVWMSAPGDGGKSIELGLESVNHAGRPLNNFGVGFAPVRAISAVAQQSIGQKPRPDCGAPIRSLTAWRMSDDPRSPYFNQYLSRPFALLANESLSTAEQQRLQQQEDREILYSGAGLRAFIDPVEAKNPVVGPFVARVDEKRKLLLPVASAQALTLFHPYLMGDNPPPPGGIVPLPATFGMVAAHSSEVRTEAEDMRLPSRRMPIVIRRSIGNQDQYEGPFGVGWDFNYNQRITELDPLSFPVGLQMPLIVRGTKADSDIAGSQDILFNTGMGRVLRFRWVSTNMPPEYAADPLVRDWDYQTLASDYYLPARAQGIFDLLVKLRDGRFERVTPEGERYRYSASGRLEMIIDRFPLNRHELEYDRNGWLVRIDDRSVRSPRFVDFGYYRSPDDPDFRDGLDEATANPAWDGKIRRLRNYAGGDVLFVYSADGFLIRRDGIQVEGENEGFSGRAQTHYTYKNCRFVGVKVTAAGTPLFTADVIENASGKPVVVQGLGIGGSVGVDIPTENSAASLNGQTGSAALADTSRAAFQFDQFGHLKSAKSSGKGSPATEVVAESNEDGLPKSIRHPEGNTETLEYDSANPIFRSRANLLRHTIDPGTRGGEGYVQEFRYDPRYNLRSGVQRDANGFEITYKLRSDGRALESIQYGAAGRDELIHNEYGQLLSQLNAYGVRTETAFDATTGFEESHHVGDNEYRLFYGGDYASRLGRPTEVSLPLGEPVRRKYNRKLQVVEMSRGELRTLTGYDEQGRAVFRQQFLGDGRAPVVRQEFDEKGFLKRSVTDGVEVDGAVGKLEYVFTPDEMSRVKSVLLPEGSLQSHEFDHLGRLVRRTVGDYVEEYGLDGNGNTLTVKKGGELVESRIFDGLDRPVTVIAHLGKQKETLELGYFRGGQPRSRKVSD